MLCLKQNDIFLPSKYTVAAREISGENKHSDIFILVQGHWQILSH